MGNIWWFQRHILYIITLPTLIIQFQRFRLCLIFDLILELNCGTSCELLSERTHHTEWMPSLHHHSDLVAMKSAFISALCWQTPSGTWTKHKQTGHKQLLLLLVTWVNASLHMLVIQRERKRRQNSTNYGVHHTNHSDWILQYQVSNMFTGLLYMTLFLNKTIIFTVRFTYHGWATTFPCVFLFMEVWWLEQFMCQCIFLNPNTDAHAQKNADSRYFFGIKIL